MSLLVNYDSTDSEDNCEDEHQSSTSVKLSSNASSSKAGLRQPSPKEDESDMIILPSAKELELRVKPPVANAKNKVVINLPSLSKICSDDEDEPPKKKIHFKSESSLLGSLPLPKFLSTKQANRPLIPHSVSTKAAPVSTTPQQPTQDEYDDEFDDDDDEDEALDIGRGMNFLVSSVEEENQPSFHESSLYRYREDIDCDQYPSEDAQCWTEGIQGPQDVQQSNQFHIPLDFARDKQFQKMMSSEVDSGVRFMDVNLIDDIKKYETMRLREVTKENMAQSHKATSQANPQSKRKHQITYLALQAKEREFDLKNQWAENKYMRKQSQTKYGF